MRNMQEEKRKVCIYFRVNDYELIKKIKERFGIKEGITVNGECYTEIRVNDWDVFRETERRGFFDIRNKKPIITNNTAIIIQSLSIFIVIVFYFNLFSIIQICAYFLNIVA